MEWEWTSLERRKGEGGRREEGESVERKWEIRKGKQKTKDGEEKEIYTSKNDAILCKQSLLPLGSYIILPSS